MARILIIEDDPSDREIAASAARAAGFSMMDCASSNLSTFAHLKNGLAGTYPLPDAILVDLDLGFEQHHEVLGFCDSTPRLARIPVVAWTQRAARNLGRLRNVYSVSKWDGIGALSEALSELASVPLPVTRHHRLGRVQFRDRT